MEEHRLRNRSERRAATARRHDDYDLGFESTDGRTAVGVIGDMLDLATAWGKTREADMRTHYRDHGSFPPQPLTVGDVSGFLKGDAEDDVGGTVVAASGKAWSSRARPASAGASARDGGGRRPMTRRPQSAGGKRSLAASAAQGSARRAGEARRAAPLSAVMSGSASRSKREARPRSGVVARHATLNRAPSQRVPSRRRPASAKARLQGKGKSVSASEQQGIFAALNRQTAMRERKQQRLQAEHAAEPEPEPEAAAASTLTFQSVFGVDMAALARHMRADGELVFDFEVSLRTYFDDFPKHDDGCIDVADFTRRIRDEADGAGDSSAAAHLIAVLDEMDEDRLSWLEFRTGAARVCRRAAQTRTEEAEAAQEAQVVVDAMDEGETEQRAAKAPPLDEDELARIQRELDEAMGGAGLVRAADAMSENDERAGDDAGRVSLYALDKERRKAHAAEVERERTRCEAETEARVEAERAAKLDEDRQRRLAANAEAARLAADEELRREEADRKARELLEEMRALTESLRESTTRQSYSDLVTAGRELLAESDEPRTAHGLTHHVLVPELGKRPMGGAKRRAAAREAPKTPAVEPFIRTQAAAQPQNQTRRERERGDGRKQHSRHLRYLKEVLARNEELFGPMRAAPPPRQARVAGSKKPMGALEAAQLAETEALEARRQ